MISTGQWPLNRPTAFLPRNLRRNLRAMPPLDASELWPVQERAIESLERSLVAGRLASPGANGHRQRQDLHGLQPDLPSHQARRERAACSFSVDLRQPGMSGPCASSRALNGSRRSAQVHRALQRAASPVGARSTTVSRVCIATIQRVYSMLKGEELDPQLEELSGFELPLTGTEPPPVEYNPDVPIETFDFIITDECQPLHLQPPGGRCWTTSTPSSSVSPRHSLPGRPIGFFQQNAGHGIQPPASGGPTT